MNPLLITAGVKAVEKINFKKTALYVGVALAVIALFFYIRKKVKEYKAEKKDEDYIKTVEGDIVSSGLSYSESEYLAMADSLEQHFGDTGLSAGFLGVNQKGVYEVMRRMKSNSDINKLQVVFGVRKFKDLSLLSPMLASLAKEKDYTLVEAVTQLLTSGERKKVNEILAENGLTYQF